MDISKPNETSLYELNKILELVKLTKMGLIIIEIGHKIVTE